MSLVWMLNEEEVNTLDDVGLMLGLIGSLTARADSLEVQPAELCAFAATLQQKVLSVLRSTEERRTADATLFQALDDSPAVQDALQAGGADGETVAGPPAARQPQAPSAAFVGHRSRRVRRGLPTA